MRKINCKEFIIIYKFIFIVFQYIFFISIFLERMKVWSFKFKYVLVFYFVVIVVMFKGRVLGRIISSKIFY